MKGQRRKKNERKRGRKKIYTHEDEEREEFVCDEYRSVIPRDAARERRELSYSTLLLGSLVKR